MNRVEQQALIKIISICQNIIKNINENNAREILDLCEDFESKLNKILISKTKENNIVSDEKPWMSLRDKSEEEIKNELCKKYKTAKELAEAFKGFLSSDIVIKARKGRIKKKETIIKHILKELKKREDFEG